MTDTKERKGKKSSKDLPMKGCEEQTFEQRKREAYSAMGKLGGQARAKQMAEKGFAMVNKTKNHSGNTTKEKDFNLKNNKKE